MIVSWLTPSLLAAVLLLSPTAWAGPFDINNKPPTSAVVTLAEAPPDDLGPTSPMLDHLRGVLARLNARQAADLRAAAGGSPVPLPQDSVRSYVIHVSTTGGPKATSRSVEVLRAPSGAYYARDLDADINEAKPMAVRLNGPKFSRIAATFSPYRGSFTRTPDDPAPGKVIELDEGRTPSVFTFDRDLMAERMNGGSPTQLEATKRVLEDHKFALRLPKGHDPKVASGLMIYIDPGRRGNEHAYMHAVADELNFIVVAPRGVGNEVYAPDRWQLGMDAIATVSSRWLVDPKRIYFTGISGGGQISTHLWLCFPDVVSGAVPVVALGSFENIPIGNGKMWQRTFGKPKAEYLKLAKLQRCAAITGKLDFNERPILLAAEILQKAGLNVRVDDYADMDHNGPTSERFTDALKWVDAPHKLKREGELTEARLNFALVASEPHGAKRNAALVEVTRVAAWSQVAWDAVRELDPTLIPKSK
jgi:hypothetical protein